MIRNRLSGLAVAACLATGCSLTGSTKGDAAVIGGGAGATVGAVVGGGKGALIGAAGGALIGALIGHSIERYDAEQAEIRAAEERAAALKIDAERRKQLSEQGAVLPIKSEKYAGGEHRILVDPLTNKAVDQPGVVVPKQAANDAAAQKKYIESHHYKLVFDDPALQ